MSESEVRNDYKEFLEQSERNSMWDFGNSILYKMCQENPKHEDKEVVIGKIWLIGRSYAAAIERRKEFKEYVGDDFYFKKVAPEMMSSVPDLDKSLAGLRSCESIEDGLAAVLATHNQLVKAFCEISGQKKISLASKYLHFHNPEMFFLYDAHARAAVMQYFPKVNKTLLKGITDYNGEYANFVCRVLELREVLRKVTGKVLSPREMDKFLLYKYEMMKNEEQSL